MSLVGHFADNLSPERTMLRDTATDFVNSELTVAEVRRLAAAETGVDPALWQQFSEMFWTGLLVPEAYGGLGLKPGDMAILLQALGGSAYQGPFFTSGVASVLAITATDNEPFKEAVLPRIADGSLICSLALAEGGGYAWSGFATRAEVNGDGCRVSGTKLFVPYAHVASKLIVAAGFGSGTGLFSVDADQSGVAIDVLPTISGAKLCSVRFESARAESLLSDESEGAGRLQHVFHQCALLTCPEMVGGATAALQMTAEYIAQRKQFGVPIGSFQAVQHKSADMLTWVDGARLLVEDGCDRLDAMRGNVAETAAICKIWTGDAYRKTMKTAHQLMGGTGYMEETDLQMYFRHAKVCELSFGSPDFYRDVLSGILGLPVPGQGLDV